MTCTGNSKDHNSRALQASSFKRWITRVSIRTQFHRYERRLAFNFLSLFNGKTNNQFTWPVIDGSANPHGCHSSVIITVLSGPLFWREYLFRLASSQTWNKTMSYHKNAPPKMEQTIWKSIVITTVTFNGDETRGMYEHRRATRWLGRYNQNDILHHAIDFASCFPAYLLWFEEFGNTKTTSWNSAFTTSFSCSFPLFLHGSVV
jgi:hypothetical protein